MSDLYIPQGSIRLDDPSYNFQLRVGFQGQGGFGKTYAALKFKNPVVLSIDKGLISHVGRKDVIEIPFYSPKFVDSIVKRDGISYTDIRNQTSRPMPPNRKDAIIRWLYSEAPKLTQEQTLVVDNSTGIQSAYHTQYWTAPSVDKDGKIKPYEEFRMKIDYFTELMMCLKSLSCDVIYIAHESPDRDDKGNLNGGVRPLLSGQFQDELTSHFTDWFRAIAIEKPATDDRRDAMIKAFGIDSITASKWVNSTPPECKTIYLWQTQADKLASCKTSLIGAPKYIISSPEAFKIYRREPEKVI